MQRSPLYVAVHEAGHAISMLSSDPRRWVDYVSLRETPVDAVGFTKGEARFQIAWAGQLAVTGQREQLVSAAKADVVDLLAGPIAEYRFRKIPRVARQFLANQWADKMIGADWTTIDEDDFSKVRLRLMWCDPQQVHRAFLDRWHDAEAVVGAHWKHILELGRWLHTVGHIEDDELFPWWQAKGG